MNRKELIIAIADKINEVAVDNAKIPRLTVERVVNTMFDKIIPGALAENTTVSINDFGKFIPTVRAARTGRNPQTGEALQIEEKMAVKFQPSNSLKETVN